MCMAIKTKISLIKCDVGSLAGHYVVLIDRSRLGPEEMEYTTVRQTLERLKERFKSA